MSGVCVKRNGTALKPESVAPKEKAPVLRIDASQKPWAKSASPSLVENRLEGGSGGRAETRLWAPHGRASMATIASANETDALILALFFIIVRVYHCISWNGIMISP